jgi:hypothetical protein
MSVGSTEEKLPAVMLGDGRFYRLSGRRILAALSYGY